MKKNLIKSYIKYTTNYLNKHKLNPVNLSAQIIPLTIYSHHLTQK